ncbi:MAG: leucine-rich repeat protein [Oscillospiraceae bacterium]|nr:leucine-rich repeat protein [Oscillospiraceae bacterium]
MADENRIKMYIDDKEKKEGIAVTSKDVIQLDAPEVLLSPDTPLLTNAQDVAGAINELFKEGGGGGDDDDDWTPPEWWLKVPDPGAYEMCFLIEMQDCTNSWRNTLTFRVCEPSEPNEYGWGPLTINWGDGTGDTWKGYEAGDPWRMPSHTYTSNGQFIVRIFATNRSCFLQEILPNGTYYSLVLIAKLGSECVVNVEDEYKDRRAFNGQYHLNYVKLSGKNGLSVEGLFAGCRALKKIDIDIPPKIIPKSVFSGCYNLKKFDFSKVEEIKEYSLENSGIIKLDLPKCTSIGNGAMFNCTRLREVNAPMCTTVGSQAFSQNYGLDRAYFSAGCKFGSDCFYDCSSLFPRPDKSIDK